MKRLAVAMSLGSILIAFVMGRLTSSAVQARQEPGKVAAEAPRKIPHPEGGYVLPFTGELTNEKGEPMLPGKYRVIFSLYSSADGTDPNCSRELAVEVRDRGQFAAQLDLDQFSRFTEEFIDGRLLYLGMRIQDRDGVELEKSPEMTPRVCIWPVLFAKNSGRLSNHTWKEIDDRLRTLERKSGPIEDPAPEPKRDDSAKSSK